MAQDNRLKIERAYLEYKEDFYEGDTAKLVQSIKPSLYKYGYWKNKISGMYAPDGQMTFIQAIQDAKRVYIKKNFAKTGSDKKVEVLDIINSIASAKSNGMVGSGIYFTFYNSRQMNGRAGSLRSPLQK